jgi:hypothetical protein
MSGSTKQLHANEPCVHPVVQCAHGGLVAHVGGVADHDGGWGRGLDLRDSRLGGFGRIVVSELEAPNMLLNLV